MSGDESDGHHDPDTEDHYHHLTHPPVNAFVDESSPLTRENPDLHADESSTGSDSGRQSWCRMDPPGRRTDFHEKLRWSHLLSNYTEDEVNGDSKVLIYIITLSLH